MDENIRGGYSGTSSHELRLVLLGNIGCGKTSSADTILGQLSPLSPNASRSCQLRQGNSEGRRVTLVEAPRWYWVGGEVEESVRKETERAMAQVAPGPHAILLLIPVNQFTEMEGHVPALLEELFGEEALDHTMVLLTCGDYLMGRTVEEYLQKEHPGLRQIIERCRGRYHVINNRQRQEREQVYKLLQKVDNMVQTNGVYYMKSIQERELERRVRDRKRELLETYRAQKEEKREMATSSYITRTEERRSIDRDRAEEYSYMLEKRRREEREKTERGTSERKTSNGLHSTPAPEGEMYSGRAEDRQETRSTPSFRLTTDGAILSQMSEAKSPKVITTFHHRINSFENKSPDEASPTSTSFSPVFRDAPSSLIIRDTPSSVNVRDSPSSPTFTSSRSSSTYTTSPSYTTYDSSRSSSVYTISRSSPSFDYTRSSLTYTTSNSSTAYDSPRSSSTYTTSRSSPSFDSSPSSSAYTTSQSSATYDSPRSSSTYTTSQSSPAFDSSSTFTSSPRSSFPSSSSSSVSSPELRLVLLGRSGSGKSAAGNDILGRREFKSCPDSFTAVTQECEKKKALVEGRRVALVDTPDWFNSERTPEEVRAQISSCVALSSPGPHAFLMCVPLDQPAKTELKALEALEAVFGPDAVQKHTMVLFTYADRLRESGKAGNSTVEAYITNQRADLLKLVEKCGDRFHVMETGGGWRERKSVVELLEKVEYIVEEAEGQCYSCPAFQEAENKVRQKQVEIAKERHKLERQERVRQLSSDRPLYSYMQPVAEAEEEVREDEIEKTRDEAERSVRDMNIDSLPLVDLSNISPSLLSSIMEKVQSTAKNLPQLLADGSVLVGEGAKKVRSSPMWGTVGTSAQNLQKMMADSGMWEKMGAGAGHVSKAVGAGAGHVSKAVGAGAGHVSKAVGAGAGHVSKAVGAGAGHVSKAVGGRVPKVVVDSSAWVGSGAKAAAASPVWGKVGAGAKSGAKLVAENSMRVGAGIGTGAKNLAQSPMWGKVGSGAKTGAKMVAEGSVKVGAGIGAGAKRVAQSPVWGKMGSGAKAGAKMVAESSVWEKIGTTAKKVPKVVIAGAILGLLLGVFLGGAVGGAVGAAAGSAVSEVGRRKLSEKNSLEKTNDAAKSVERSVNNSLDSLAKQGDKLLKTE